MENQRDEFWNQRYQSETYVYGEEPNDFFASQIVDIKPGNIIFPCEGEGRNAVYAAILGWKVQAFDGSLEGQKKAFLLASKNKVSIDYKVTDATIVEYP
ncbi:MAG: SAM-dependent methyltransferase, partial [Sphingobacteriia bacterium 39-39-8]